MFYSYNMRAFFCRSLYESIRTYAHTRGVLAARASAFHMAPITPAGGTLARLSRAAGMMYPHTMQKPPEPPSDALRGHCVSEWVARLI